MYPRLAGFIPQPDSPSYNRPVVIYEAAVRHAHRPELRRRAPFALCYPDFIGTVLAGTPGWVRPANSASRLGTVSGQVSRLVSDFLGLLYLTIWLMDLSEPEIQFEII